MNRVTKIEKNSLNISGKKNHSKKFRIFHNESKITQTGFNKDL